MPRNEYQKEDLALVAFLSPTEAATIKTDGLSAAELRP
jgi:hypothetical protein